MTHVGRKLIIPLLAGCGAVLGPLCLHEVVGDALARRVGSTLARRTGARAQVAGAWPTGPISPGVVATGVTLEWRSAGADDDIQKLHVAETVVSVAWDTRRPSRIELRRPRLSGRSSTADLEAHLRMLRKKRRASSRTAAHRTGTDVQVEGLSIDLEIRDGPVRRVIAGPVDLAWSPCAEIDGRCLSVNANRFALAFGRAASLTGKGLAFRTRLKARRSTPRSCQPSSPPGRWRTLLKKASRLDLQELTAAGLRLHLPPAWGGIEIGSVAKSSSFGRAGQTIDLAVQARKVGVQLFEIQALARHRSIPGSKIALKGLADAKRGTLRVAASANRFPVRFRPASRSGVTANHASITGELSGEIDRGGSGRIQLSGRTVADLTFRHRALAQRPIRFRRLSAEGSGSLVWRSGMVDINIPAVELASRKARVSLAVKARRTSGRVRLSVDAELPKTPCQRLLDGLPDDLVPKLATMELAGKLGGRLALRLDTRDLDNLRLDLQPGDSRCRVTRDPQAADVNTLNSPFTMQVRGRGGEKRSWVVGPRNPYYRSLASLPRHLVYAFLTTEDRKFFDHRGFDFEQIGRALAYDIEHGGFYKGASSISQQLIKNVFLSHSRNISRKLQEAVLTWRMEQVVSKRRILELYLNLIELGPGIYGVGHAARTYFNRPPTRLTPLQSLHLAAITPNPRRYYRDFKGGRITMAWLLELRRLLGSMHRQGHISKPRYASLRRKELLIAAF
jgi:hypothetical protein